MPISANPTTLSFAYPGAASQTAALSGASSYTATSSPSGIVGTAVSGSNLIVTPQGQGTATITVSGGGSTATVSVTVGAPPGALTVAPSSLSLTLGGYNTLSVSRTGDTGAFSIRSQPPGLATFSGGGNGPGPVSFTVTSETTGTGQVIISAQDGTQTSVALAVYGPLSAFPVVHRYAGTITVSVARTGFSGIFTPSFTGANSATISPPTANGPTASFTISGLTAGASYSMQVADAFGTATCSFTANQPPIGNVACLLQDETGLNPLPPGLGYQLYFAGDPIVSPVQSTVANPTTIVASGFVGVSGAITLPLLQSTAYVLVMQGQQAPQAPIAFNSGTATSLAIPVVGYRGPYRSQTGYTLDAMRLWSRGWVGEKYKVAGSPGTTSNAFNVAWSINSVLSLSDLRQQAVLASLRIDSCSGSQVVSYTANGTPVLQDTMATFFAQYLGSTLPRLPGETDAQYKIRGINALSGKYLVRVKQAGTASGYFEALNPTGTFAAVQSGVGSLASILATAQSAWNSAGNMGGLTTFDSQYSCSYDPTLTTSYTLSPVQGTQYQGFVSQLNLQPPQFVVLIPSVSTVGYDFFVGQSGLNQNAYLVNLGNVNIIPPSSLPPALVAAVNSRRAFGTVPLFGQLSS